MAIKKGNLILILIFLLVLGARLYFTFSQENFSSDESYYNLEQTTEILKTGHPSSYYLFGGSSFTTSPPLFPYALSFFALILPIGFVGKLLPQIFASSLVFIIYFLSLNLTRNKRISYFNAFIGGTVPIFLKTTTNTISTYSLAIPLFFLSLLFLLNLNKGKKFAYLFIASVIALMFTNPLALTLILSLACYLIFIKSTKLKQDPLEVEVIIFSALVVVWFLILFFKNIFLIHGYGTIWQNTPMQILQIYFSEIGFLEAIYAIGIIPLLAGIFIIYKYLINRNKRPIYLFSSVIFISFILMWFRLIKSVDALTILAISLIIISSQFYLDFKNMFLKTKIPLKTTILSFFTIFIILISLFPSAFYLYQTSSNSFSSKEVNAMVWLKENTPEDSTIAALYNEGHAINYLAERNTLINQNFFIFQDSNQRFIAHNQIFSSEFVTNILRETTHYDVDYIYFSQRAKEYFNLDSIPYIDNECFERVYNGEIQIFKIKCTI